MESWNEIDISVNVNKQGTGIQYSFGKHTWQYPEAKGLIAVGASHYVAIVDPIEARYIGTLRGHEGDVLSVNWVPNPSSINTTTTSQQNSKDDENNSLLSSSSSTLSSSSLPYFNDEEEIVSGSRDGTVRVWKLQYRKWDTSSVTGKRIPYSVGGTCTAVLKGHTGPVTSVQVLRLKDHSLFIASVSVDCSVRTWYRPPPSASVSFPVWVPIACGTVKPSAVYESVALTILPGFENSLPISNKDSVPVDIGAYGILIATGGADNKIHLFHVNGKLTTLYEPSTIPSTTHYPGQLTELLVLGSHTNWIRSLHFSYHTLIRTWFGNDACYGGIQNENRYCMLASASQDGKVRLWKISQRPTVTTTTTIVSSSPVKEGLSIPVVDNINDDDDTDNNDEINNDNRIDKSTVGGTLSANMSTHEFEQLLLNLADQTTQQSSTASTTSSSSSQHSLRRPTAFSIPEIYKPTINANVQYDALLEALLTGHEAWVHCVRWHCPVGIYTSSTSQWRLWQPPAVYSSSSDKSVIIWQPTGSQVGSTNDRNDNQDPTYESSELVAWEGVWEPSTRIGSTGGASLGMFSAALSPDGEIMTAHGFQGALHTWRTSVNNNRDPLAPFLRILRNYTEFNLSGINTPKLWRTKAAPGGHFGSITDAVWGAQGKYLLTTSLDSTTRAWAPVSTSIDSIQVNHTRWWEIGRPQIHGYEMNAIGVPNFTTTNGVIPHRIFTGGDEKVLRVFDAPKLFFRSLTDLCSSTLTGTGYTHSLLEDYVPTLVNSSVPYIRAESAYLPELSLTNKAVLGNDMDTEGKMITDRFQFDGKDAARKDENEQYKEFQADVQNLIENSNEDGSRGTKLPTTTTVSNVITPESVSVTRGSTDGPQLEEDLVLNTRWPEVDRLFGHLNEITAIGTDTSGQLLASSCKARTEETATIWIWDTVIGRSYQQLTGAHKLTVEKLEFSPSINYIHSLSDHGIYAVRPYKTTTTVASSPSLADYSDYLVSVGRDRVITIYQGRMQSTNTETNQRTLPPKYSLLKSFIGHKRQIWGISMAPVPLISTGNGNNETSDLRLFATGSRDQYVRLWTIMLNPKDNNTVTTNLRMENIEENDKKSNGNLPVNETFQGIDGTCTVLTSLPLNILPVFESSITSVAFAPVVRFVTHNTVSILTTTLAVGLENGTVSLWSIKGYRTTSTDDNNTYPNPAPSFSSHNGWKWSAARLTLANVEQEHSHCGAVNRIVWRPIPSTFTVTAGEPSISHSSGAIEKFTLEMVTCGADHTLRFSSVDLTY